MAFVDDVEGRPQVWVQSVTGGPAMQITFVDQIGLGWTRWSPSGEQIYFNYGGSIWSVPAVGGAQRRIIARGKNPSVSADGRTLVYEGGGPDAIGAFGWQTPMARSKEESSIDRSSSPRRLHFRLTDNPSCSSNRAAGRWAISGSSRHQAAPHGA